MNVAQSIRASLDVLAPQQLAIIDESAAHAGHAGSSPSGETHWRVEIVSARFEGLAQVARHRLIYDALGDLMRQPIHALQIRARTPTESDTTTLLRSGA